MSSIPRLFVSALLEPSVPLRLEEDASKYLMRVMRLSPGDRLRTFNGLNGEWLCELGPPEGKTAIIIPVEQTREQMSADTPHLALLFAPVKKAETDFIVEKATELGARSIQPVITQFTQTRTVRLDRFNKIALEAAEQTERLDLPEISDLVVLEEALAQLDDDTALIFCDEAGEDESKPWGGESGRAGAALSVLDSLKDRSAAILIGPEGGFSQDERQFLRARADTYPISLGPRILRAETAVVSALTLWQAVCGDWT
ncbi:16S rRNA (uracil(1498)-N(3))-methyltransferase [Hyphomonas sp.]|uniref:16S rRNA (uracil(1498)-N(3))-methyltransferase n=1 Tax=Hyphomonas sp. TaxID=87 RepID=UPI002605BF12|nr:16S rRNA (uracil(1498)-N(3))-methyltransferase [Hyphomonas sp.]MDF1807772.1 16S rRNA (uracil(1498)-N(3))-methyltransferase [Hyphomonas sp.]